MEIIEFKVTEKSKKRYIHQGITALYSFDLLGHFLVGLAFVWHFTIISATSPEKLHKSLHKLLIEFIIEFVF